MSLLGRLREDAERWHLIRRLSEREERTGPVGAPPRRAALDRAPSAALERLRGEVASGERRMSGWRS